MRPDKQKIITMYVELKRNFTPLEVFGIGFSAIGLVPSITCVLH